MGLEISHTFSPVQTSSKACCSQEQRQIITSFPPHSVPGFLISLLCFLLTIFFVFSSPCVWSSGPQFPLLSDALTMHSQDSPRTPAASHHAFSMTLTKSFFHEPHGASWGFILEIHLSSVMSVAFFWNISRFPLVPTAPKQTPACVSLVCRPCGFQLLSSLPLPPS